MHGICNKLDQCVRYRKDLYFSLLSPGYRTSNEVVSLWNNHLNTQIGSYYNTNHTKPEEIHFRVELFKLYINTLSKLFNIKSTTDSMVSLGNESILLYNKLLEEHIHPHLGQLDFLDAIIFHKLTSPNALQELNEILSEITSKLNIKPVNKAPMRIN